MNVEETINLRSNSSCELCKADNGLTLYTVAPEETLDADKSIQLCQICLGQINQQQELDSNHWRCLNDSMWSQVPAVQIMAWRMLKRLSTQSELWAQDLLDMLYLDEEMQTWAEAGQADENESVEPTKDSNGATLEAGDTVTLIKDLDVKGAGFTAKRGTAVRNISLTSNPEHIEGRVNGTRIVLLTCFLKKSN
jgi:protein PhnA